MTLLADMIDPFASLYQNWPWMLIVVGVGRWFAAILERTATRHITFIDALDKRDAEGLTHQATTSIALGAISEKLSESRSKLSGIESILKQNQNYAETTRSGVPAEAA